jgi:Flp pilus assembly protein TadG
MMRRRPTRFAPDTGAVAALEFALTFPPFIMIILSLITFGRVMWTLNGLQEAGYQTARCVAIANSACATPATYAVNLATSYGVVGLTAAEVAVTNSSACNQATSNRYVQVTITFPAYAQIAPLLPSFTTNLVTTACYPTTGL